MNKTKKAMLEKIRSNIANNGHHIYIIAGGPSPRFAYTIGVSESLGYELILAGSSFYSIDEVRRIVNSIAENLRVGDVWQTAKMDIDSLGTFSLQLADSSWIKKMLFGALDFYDVSDISVRQIIPDDEHWTSDIPNLAKSFSIDSEPVWKWLSQQWGYPVPENSKTITNIDALKGKSITEVMRWEDDQWEMFAGAGPDVPREDIREVSLGTLLGIDQSLYPVVNLDVGKGLWRDSDDLKWHPWG